MAFPIQLVSRKQPNFMSIAETLLPELEQEAATTKRVLERVPEDKLAWEPHEKSMSLARLATHTAGVPGDVADLVSPDEFQLPDTFPQPELASVQELLDAADSSVAKAKEYLSGLDDAAANTTWTLSKGGQVLMALPRIAVIRTLMFNHWYHHRGQLSVYLRLLNVPVPSIYGPSADESPFS